MTSRKTWAGMMQSSDFVRAVTLAERLAPSIAVISPKNWPARLSPRDDLFAGRRPDQHPNLSGDDEIDVQRFVFIVDDEFAVVEAAPGAEPVEPLEVEIGDVLEKVYAREGLHGHSTWGAIYFRFRCRRETTPADVAARLLSADEGEGGIGAFD